MSEKLGQSLDEILASQRMSAARGGRNNNRRGRSAGGRATTAAPVGGITKSKKPVKGVTKVTPTGPSGGNSSSRIMISNLPFDVTEQQVKEYFLEAKLSTKSVLITYGPNGASRGEAAITFHRPADAGEAVRRLNGVKVDNRPLSVSLLVDAKSAAALPFVQSKKLNDRITAPKPQPKSATITKPANTNGNAQGAKRGAKRGARGARGGRDARPAKKTAEELDLEMADYWESGNGAVAENGAGQTATQAAQPATNGDATMDDEIL